MTRGDVAPRGAIAGDRTGLYITNQIQLFGSKGWIIATRSTTDTESEPEGTVGI